MIDATAEFNREKAAEDMWEALRSADAFVQGTHRFAAGQSATLKVEAERLYNHPKQLAIVMGHFAAHPFVKAADVLVYVPKGTKRFITELGKELGKPVAHTIRNPSAPPHDRYNFTYQSLADKELLLAAKNPFVGEDVISTLGSVAGVGKLFRPEQQIHALGMLLRGTVNPMYRLGSDGNQRIFDDYLLERFIPLDKDEFHLMYPDVTMGTVEVLIP
jgi:hypothetical protein